ncbi:MAG: hypothetical protein AMXMBFR58_27110 [Phycisphaerae bacterium]
MRCNMMVASLLIAAGASSTLGQSINIDLNLTPGAYPAALYGAAGRSGYWNDVNNTSPGTMNLCTIHAPGPTGVTLTWDKSVAVTNSNDSNTTGNPERLLDDGQFRGGPGKLIYTISHLEAGKYAVFTYAGRPAFSSDYCWVKVNGSPSQTQLVGGNITHDLPIGVSHSVHIVTIPANGSIQIEVGESAWGNAACSGIQLEKLDGDRLRFYVDKSQTANDELGDAWEYAYSDLQPVLKAAALIGGEHCEIWTASGFYYPTTGFDRNISFVVPSGLHLYGGFNGTEQSLDSRLYPWFHITAMSGAIGGGSAIDNSYHVVDASNCGSSTVIDGFTIAGGYANGPGEKSRGGGLYAVNSSVDLRWCKLISNYAALEGGGAYTSLYPGFDNVLFYNNESDRTGGGIHHAGVGKPVFYNTEFTGNESLGGGGGAMISFADAAFFNCLFSGNYTASTHAGSDGGGVGVDGDSTDDVSITNCTFSLNKSGTVAGGVWVEGQATVNLRNSILWGNIGLLASYTVDEQWDKAATATLTKSSNCIEGVNSNPQFVDADGVDNVPGTTDDNCHLQAPFSSAMENGDESLLPWDFSDVDGDGNTFEYYPFDLDGNPRIVYFGGGPYGGLDLGCYEVQWCPADYDASGFVDLDDYSAFVADFEAGVQKADFEKTGFVDTDDFDAFVAAFQEGC